MNPRTRTLDVRTVAADGTVSTRIHLKRCCNGCGGRLGDLDGRDFDAQFDLTDVRGECPNCAPIVELEAAGCTTWQLTPRNYVRIDRVLDRADVFAKQFTEVVDGKVVTVGMRVGQRPDRVVARFGDWIIRHPDGRFAVHHGPEAAS